jgi:hypothetical protein
MAGSSNNFEVLAVMMDESMKPVQCMTVTVEDHEDDMEQDIEFLPLSDEDEPLEVFKDVKNTGKKKKKKIYVK